MATRCVEENAKKARGAFFKLGGIGTFQGDLSPLSTNSVIDTCVLPVLLYGSENWFLSEGNLVKLNFVWVSCANERFDGHSIFQTQLQWLCWV